MTRFLTRAAGAALLKPAIFEDVEADQSAITGAVVLVIVSAIAAGIGSFGIIAGRPAALAVIIVLALAVWVIWAVITYEIGARLMPAATTQADVGQLLRTLGFASAPGVLRVFGVIPGATTVVFAFTEVWMLMAMVVAIRQALDFTSTTRAAVVCALGWAVAIIFGIIVGGLFVPTVS